MDSELIVDRKMKKVFKIPLIIIGSLIIFIIGVGCFIYFYDGNTYNIYNKIIDEMFLLIDDEVDNIVDKRKSTGEISLEITGENLTASEESLMSIFNDLSINYIIEEDAVNEKANVNLETKYNNEELLSAYVNFIGKDVFFKIPSLYDKAIKSNEDVYLVSLSKKDIKIILNEFKKIIQNSLKEEYFYKEKVSLKINNKKILTTKHVLDIDSTELYELKKSIIDDIKSNDNLLDILAKINSIDKNEVVSILNSLRDELNVTEDFVKVELYINLLTKDVEKLSLIDSVNNLVFTRKNEMYEFTNVIDDETKILGNISYDDDNVRLLIDYDGVLLDIVVSDDNLKLKLIENESIMNVNISSKDDKINYLYELSVLTDDNLNVKVSMQGVTEEVSKISDKILSKYVMLDEITEEDYLKIYEKLYNNNVLLNLIMDITAIYENYYSLYYENFNSYV